MQKQSNEMNTEHQVRNQLRKKTPCKTGETIDNYLCRSGPDPIRSLCLYILQ